MNSPSLAPTENLRPYGLQQDSPFYRLPTELILQIMSSLKTGELGIFIIGAYRPLATRGILTYRSLYKIKRLLARSIVNKNVLTPLSRLPAELQDEILVYLSIQERIDLFIANAG